MGSTAHRPPRPLGCSPKERDSGGPSSPDPQRTSRSSAGRALVGLSLFRRPGPGGRSTADSPIPDQVQENRFAARVAPVLSWPRVQALRLDLADGPGRPQVWLSPWPALHCSSSFWPILLRPHSAPTGYDHLCNPELAAFLHAKGMEMCVGLEFSGPLDTRPILIHGLSSFSRLHRPIRTTN